MYLSNVKLWNFRQFGNDSAPLDLKTPHLNLIFKNGMNVLIGENDSGKTAIIDAIRIVLKTQDYDWYRITKEDFYNESKRFRIELRFDNLSDDEAKNFVEWLSFESQGDGTEKRFYLRIIYDVERDDARVFSSDVCAGSDETGRPLNAEARDLLRVTYLKPLRDAATELTPGRYSRLSSILFASDLFNKGKNQTELDSHLSEFNTFIQNFFSDDQKQGYKIKDILDKYLKKFISSDSESKFSFASTDLKNTLSKLELELKEKINPGLGSLNRLYMATELLNLKRGNWNGLKLGLIEELEAHLHPQAQMKVIEQLCDSCQDEKIQFILTTHSPNLASKLKLKDLILCTQKQCFPLGEEYTKLNANGYIFLEKFLDVTKANLFFAKGLIFVEGWAEQIFLPAFVNLLKEKGIITQNLTESGVSIVNVGSVAFLEYSKIFQRKDASEINIPIAIITDSDVAAYKKEKKDDKEEIVKRDDSEISSDLKDVLPKKELKYNYQSHIKAFLAKDWTFEYALYRSNVFSHTFIEKVKTIHSKTDFSNFELSLAEKLLSQSLKKTEIAYLMSNYLNDKSKTASITKSQLESDDSILYLIDAIKFVCK